MKLLGDITNKSLSEKVASQLNVTIEYPDVFVFPDGEKRVRIIKSVLDEEVFIIKSLCPPVADNLLELCFVADAAKRNGAKKVSAIIPYLGYSRGDHMFRTGEASPLSIVIKTIEASGIDEITLFDLHSIKIPEMFSIPVHHESAFELFAEKIRSLFPDTDNIVIVSPDMGGIRRTKLLSEMLGTNFAVISKDRDLETGKITKVHLKEGRLKKISIIIDDMISTGVTMVEAIDTLRKEGAKEIFVFATHPILSANASSILQSSPTKKIFVTNTIGIPREKQFEKLEILSIASIIGSTIKSIR